MRTSSAPSMLTACLLLVGITGLQANPITNPGFESGDLTDWTPGGTGRVAAIQGSDITGTGANVTAPEGNWFAVLSNGPGGAGGVLRIDNNTTNDFDPATLEVTVDIPQRPSVLAFDWSFGTSEQDQPGGFDDIFDVSLYQGAAPADPFTGSERVFSGSSPRNTGASISNFPDAPIRGTNVVNWTINNAGTASGSLIRFGFHDWQRTCIGIPLPDNVAPPYTRTLRFRVADQADSGFDSALLIDNVQIRPACDATPSENITQITQTSASQVIAKDAGLLFRQASNRVLAMDPSGAIVALASNADLDGTNPNFVEQVFLREGLGGWQRVTGLPMQDGGEVKGLAFSGQATTGPGAGQIAGRYLAIAARVAETGSTEIYRWDRYSQVLDTLTSTTGCNNLNPAINRGGDVITFDSDCGALTGAGGSRHVLVWAGGGINTVTNISGTGTCTARNPHINHHSNNGGRDGRYVVFEADCNYGSNGDANQEIFRFRRDNSRREQLTNTGAGILNSNPQLDREAQGREVYYLSTQNTGSNADGTLQVFRVRCNNENCNNQSGLTQWTSNGATDLTISFRVLPEANPNSNSVNSRFVFERLDLLTGIFAVGYQAGSSAATERIVSLQPSIQGLTGGYDANPLVGFITSADITGQNTDANAEAFLVEVID